MILALLSLLAVQPAAGERAEQERKSNPDTIRQVMLHPIFAETTMCGEHAAGQLPFLGDALGQDCMIVGMNAHGIFGPYRTDGRTNADWFGWKKPVLAPQSGRIGPITENPVTNEPGKVGRPPASGLSIISDAGVTVVVAHMGEIRVAQGDTVEAGQVIGTVGNNGFGRAPHIHVGAFDDTSALQVRWDLKAAARLADR